MRLQAETPLRIFQAISDGRLDIGSLRRTIHRLEQKMVKGQFGIGWGQGARLGVDEFEFITAVQQERRTRFRADTEPIDAGRAQDRAIGFDGNPKALLVQGGGQRFVELQQRLAAGADDQTMVVALFWPKISQGLGQSLGVIKTSGVGSDKIGIAELADRPGTILFPTRP